MVEWSYFYDKYLDLTDSKLKSYISLLEDIDDSDELVEVVVDIENRDIKAMLVRKALDFMVEFNMDNLSCLEDEIPEDLFLRIVNEAPLDFGTSEDVTGLLENIYNDKAIAVIYKRATMSGIGFNHDQLERMDMVDDEDEEEDYNQERTASDTAAMGCLGFIMGNWLFDLFGKKDKGKGNEPHRRPRQESRGLFDFSPSTGRRDGKCDGNCAKCPPHYGYRHGRWYYGHGHQHGCERCGNGGASGKCTRD